MCTLDRAAALMSTLLFVFVVTAGAAEPPPPNPNGFPSGGHYNLNLIGKKAGFDGCTVPLDAYNQPLYGNVVFVPEYGEGDIWLISGSGRKSTVSTLQVTDPCVSAFDQDAAEVQLPARADGYWVYARVLGKLDDNIWMQLTPELLTVSNEYETLVYLGLVTPNGFVTADGKTLIRTKGKHPAVPLSELFAWQGSVCYAFDPATIGLTGYSPTPMCAKDTNADGNWDEIVPPVLGACPDASYTLTSLYCHYYDTEWVFNVADIVSYLWGVDNNGSKLVQIRFYPR